MTITLSLAENKQSEEDIENGGLYDSLLSVFHDSASKESKDSSKEIQQLLEQAAEDIRDYHVPRSSPQ